MYIRFIKSVDGQPINDPPAPYHEHPDRARALIAAGLAIEVPRDASFRMNTVNGLTTLDVLDETGQVISSERPDPDAKWLLVPEKRMSGDWTQAPYLVVRCTSCGSSEVRQGKKAYEKKFRHCPIVTLPKIGNYVHATIDECPEAVVKQFKRLYDLWASENKSASGVYQTEDIYNIQWARRADAEYDARVRRLERQPQYDEFDKADESIQQGRPETAVPNRLEAVDKRRPGSAWANVIKVKE